MCTFWGGGILFMQEIVCLLSNPICLSTIRSSFCLVVCLLICLTVCLGLEQVWFLGENPGMNDGFHTHIYINIHWFGLIKQKRKVVLSRDFQNTNLELIAQNHFKMCKNTVFLQNTLLGGLVYKSYISSIYKFKNKQ